jgi:RNA-directed DNA polymerase
VQTALCNVLEPIFEVRFAPTSRVSPRRGCKDALRRVQQMLNAGHIWVVDADIRKYFDSIPHDRLMAEVEKEVADGRVLELLRSYLKAEVLDGLEGWTPEDGTPQGAVISPLLANVYLHPVDSHGAPARDGALRRRLRGHVESGRGRGHPGSTGFIEEHGLSLHPEGPRRGCDQSGGLTFLVTERAIDGCGGRA